MFKGLNEDEIESLLKALVQHYPWILSIKDLDKFL